MASVEIHSDFESAFSVIADSFPGFEEQLRLDFIRFIESDRMEYPDYFGRDSIYNWPQEAEAEAVSHMHIALPPRVFQKSALIDRTNPRIPDKDACLVYCEHAVSRGRILFLDFFYPDAHKMAHCKRTMQRLARNANLFHDDW